MRTAILLVLLSSSAVAGARIEMNDGWVFKAGDDPGWAAPDLDDSKWKPIEVGVVWEKAGYPGLDGFGWYRARVTIPGKWGRTDAVRECGWIVLDLGPIDDADETFFNGKKIGETGKLPPDYEQAWDKPRAYRILAEDVKWGEENVIAVRVYDGNGDAGIYGGPVSIREPGKREMVTVDFVPGVESAVFPAGAELVAEVTLRNKTGAKIAGKLECRWRTDNVREEKLLGETSEKIVVTGGGSARRSFRLSPGAPGFYRVDVELKFKGEEPIGRGLVLGSDVEAILPPLTREPDFDEFWAARRRELAAVDPEYRVERDRDKSTDRVAAYLVEMRSYSGVRVRGWLTVPKKRGPFPAILRVAGYGGNMQADTSRDDVVVLALNIRGQGNSRQDVDGEGEEYMWMGLTDDPADYIYVGAYLDCVRGIDFLCTRPEVDSRRIGVAGGSQGGGLTLATAALDSRVAAASPHVPWLGDWAGYEETAPWAVENTPKILKARPDLSREQYLRTLSYIDTMNLAGWIRCPVLVGLGLVDDTCPPRTILATLNRIQSDKEVRYYPYGGHEGGGRAFWRLSEEWLREKLGATPPGKGKEL